MLQLDRLRYTQGLIEIARSEGIGIVRSWLALATGLRFGDCSGVVEKSAERDLRIRGEQAPRKYLAGFDPTLSGISQVLPEPYKFILACAVLLSWFNQSPCKQLIYYSIR